MSPNISLQNGELVTILMNEKEQKKIPFISLRWILLAGYAVVGIVPLLLLASTMLHSVQDYFVEERKKELLSQANVISGQLTSSHFLIHEKTRGPIEEMILETSQNEDFRVLVLDASCVVVYDTGYEDVGKTYLLPEVLQAMDDKDTAKEQEDGTVYAAASVMGLSNQRSGVVLIVDGMKDVQSIVGDIGQEAYLLLACIVTLLFIIMVVISKVFTEPVKGLIGIIKEMSQGHFERRAKVEQSLHTELVDLADACNQMADQLELVESSRQQFVSNVSHELKTPLSSVKVLSESILLMEDVPKEMYVEFLHDINSEVDRMTAIINDLLTLVKLDQKEIPINFRETDLNQMMAGIMKRLQPLADEKGVVLETEYLKEITADADEMKLSLAISNLADNAIKYTAEGGKVKVTLDADHQHTFITVADTGIGIPEDEVNRIFERFYRVDKTRDRETGGTGLGLSITHATIMMHKGSIKVNSKEEEGTTILVRIPLKQQQPAAQA